MAGTLQRKLWLFSARAFLRYGRYDQAQRLLIRGLNTSTTDSDSLKIYACLAQSEFHRGHFLNARHYAGQYLQAIELSAQGKPLPAGVLKLHERVRWYHDASQEAAEKHRRRH